MCKKLKFHVYHGLILYVHSADNRVPVVVVIVDDNSGSMGGERSRYCVLKTKVNSATFVVIMISYLVVHH